MKLNLGCGSQVIDGWVNVDYALGARMAKIPLFKLINKKIKLFELDWDNNIFIHDPTKPFPWQTNSVDIIYCSHTLEHFTRTEGLAFLKECYRVLKKGGIIRILVPDLAHIIQEYIEERLRADYFMEALGSPFSTNNNTIKSRFSFLIKYPHKCMYDSPTLIKILNEIGFTAKNRKPFDSNIEDIKKIEIEERTIHSIIVEGIK